MTESALLKQLIELTVQRVSQADVDVLRSPARRLRAARLNVRLHPEDQLLLMERSAARQMPAATYVSALEGSNDNIVKWTPRSLYALTRAGLDNAWQDPITAAIEAEVITREQRFTLHGLKHRGITDTEGKKAGKKEASGHKTDAMLDLYDHEVAWSSPRSRATQRVFL